jgi:6-pyruvoyltetrahydropterin/6-carboxytetrahydropterin synthase
MSYLVTKTYGNDRGLSTTFRQWKARDSHCRYLHGYALGFRIRIETETLNEQNWVFDFGGFRQFKAWLDKTFDHKTIVASDDPEIDSFYKLRANGLCDLIVLKDVGCEAFAKLAHDVLKNMISETRVKIIEVEVFEHGSNSASYRP